MTSVDLAVCKTLGKSDKNISYAVIDKDGKWRPVKRYGVPYIQWTYVTTKKKNNTCKAIVSKEMPGSLFEDVLLNGKLVMFETISRIYLVLMLSESHDSYVKSPTVRYEFEKKIIQKIPSWKLFALLGSGTALLLSGLGIHMLNKSRAKTLEKIIKEMQSIHDKQIVMALELKQERVKTDQLQSQIENHVQMKKLLERKITDLQSNIQVPQGKSIENPEIVQNQDSDVTKALEDQITKLKSDEEKNTKIIAELNTDLEEQYKENLYKVDESINKIENLKKNLKLEIAGQLEKSKILKENEANIVYLNQSITDLKNQKNELELALELARRELTTSESKTEEVQERTASQCLSMITAHRDFKSLLENFDRLVDEVKTSKLSDAIVGPIKILQTEIKFKIDKYKECKDKWTDVECGLDETLCEFLEVLSSTLRDVMTSRGDLMNKAQVYVRINPRLIKEHKQRSSGLSVTNPSTATHDQKVCLLGEKQGYGGVSIYDFNFPDNDSVFRGCIEKDKYDKLNSIKGSIMKVSKGYSQVVLGFGVSGSGKSYTLGLGAEENIGIFQLSLELLKKECGLKSRSILIFDEYVNEVRTSDNGVNGSIHLLHVDEDMKSIVQGFKDLGINIVYDVINSGDTDTESILLRVNKRRKSKKRIKPTPNNAASSRSHLYIVLKCVFEDNKVGYLTFVDMAGNEQPYDIYTKLIAFKTTNTSANLRSDLIIRNENNMSLYELFKHINKNTTYNISAGEVNDSWPRYFNRFPTEYADVSMADLLNSKKEISGGIVMPKWLKLMKGRKIDITKTQMQWLKKLLSEGYYVNESLNYMKSYLHGWKDVSNIWLNKGKSNEGNLPRQVISMVNPKYTQSQWITFDQYSKYVLSKNNKKAYPIKSVPPTELIFQVLDNLPGEESKPSRFSFIFVLMPGYSKNAISGSKTTLEIANSFMLDVATPEACST
jgi:hypothetical protein